MSSTVYASFVNSILSTLYPILTIYSYYVLVGKYCIDAKRFDSVVVLIMFLIYHVLLIYTLIFYMRILAIDDTSTANRFPSKVANKQAITSRYFNPFIEEEIIQKRLKMLKTCNICVTYKPPRTHHCSICQKCFLRFDHHCGLLGVCIAFHNYKFFYLFVIMNIIYCLFLIILLMFELIKNRQLPTASFSHFIVLTSLLFVEMCVSLQMFIYHTILIRNNETMIENKALNAFMRGDQGVRFVYQEGPLVNEEEVLERDEMNPYNIGVYENWEQIFGKNTWEWFLPTFTTLGDGINFPKKIDRT